MSESISNSPAYRAVTVLATASRARFPSTESTTWKYLTRASTGVPVRPRGGRGNFYTRLAEPHERLRGGQNRRAPRAARRHAHVVGPGCELLRCGSTSPARAIMS